MLEGLVHGFYACGTYFKTIDTSIKAALTMNPPNPPPQPPQPDYAALNTAFGDIRQSLLDITAHVSTVQEVGRMANQPTNAVLLQQNASLT